METIKEMEVAKSEKNLALSWEDAQLIHIFTCQVKHDFDKDISLFNSSQEMYEEVLRRFNEKRKLTDNEK